MVWDIAYDTTTMRFGEHWAGRESTERQTRRILRFAQGDRKNGSLLYLRGYAKEEYVNDDHLHHHPVQRGD